MTVLRNFVLCGAVICGLLATCGPASAASYEYTFQVSADRVASALLGAVQPTTYFYLFDEIWLNPVIAPGQYSLVSAVSPIISGSDAWQVTAGTSILGQPAFDFRVGTSDTAFAVVAAAPFTSHYFGRSTSSGFPTPVAGTYLTSRMPGSDLFSFTFSSPTEINLSSLQLELGGRALVFTDSTLTAFVKPALVGATMAAVPEPGTAAGVSISLILLFSLRRRYRR